MRLNKTSMDKLFDLITMGLKYQVRYGMYLVPTTDEYENNGFETPLLVERT